MANGIEITQGGVDIRHAADYQKILDSRWEYLEIANEQLFSYGPDNDLTGNIPLVKILDHNLGYLPAFTHSGTFNVYADTKSIYADVNFVLGGTEFIRVFKCDITAEYLAPSNIVSGAGTSSRSPVGIRVLNENYIDINSNTATDYSLNTDLHQMSIHLHGVRTVNPTTGHLVFNHNTGYPPTYFIAPINNNFLGLTKSINAINDTKGFATANSYQLDIRGAQGTIFGDYAVLILKDPLDVAS